MRRIKEEAILRAFWESAMAILIGQSDEVDCYRQIPPKETEKFQQYLGEPPSSFPEDPQIGSKWGHCTLKYIKKEEKMHVQKGTKEDKFCLSSFCPRPHSQLTCILSYLSQFSRMPPAFGQCPSILSGLRQPFWHMANLATLFQGKFPQAQTRGPRGCENLTLGQWNDYQDSDSKKMWV